MPCEQIPLVHRLAVENPKSLNHSPWKDHLQACEECRNDKIAYERSLAVFRQIESQAHPPEATAPSWERFSQRLSSHRQGRRLLSRWHWRIPTGVAAAVAVLSLMALLSPSIQQGDEKALPPLANSQDGQSVQGGEADLSNTLNFIAIAPSRFAGPETAFRSPSEFTAAGRFSNGGSSLIRPAGNTKAPILLFRSLRQKRSLQFQSTLPPRSAIDTTPASSMHPVDPSFPRYSRLTPIPIR